MKAVFTTLEELFKPTVMFFGLTNFLAIFKTIINEILWDLINTGEVASFIDNIIVGITNFIQFVSPQPVDQFSQTEISGHQ